MCMVLCPHMICIEGMCTCAHMLLVLVCICMWNPKVYIKWLFSIIILFFFFQTRPLISLNLTVSARMAGQ